MKGFKIIPLFLFLIILAYLGVMFVEANRDEVVIHFGSAQSGPTAIGFVVLTSLLIGMVVASSLCSVELLFLYVQNKKLKRKLAAATRASANTARTVVDPRDLDHPEAAVPPGTPVRQP